MTDDRTLNVKYRFSGFVFDAATGDLDDGERRQTLAPQVATALALLAGRAGDLVTREELRAALWPDGRVVSYELAIATCMRQLRKALGDDPRAPRFVQTIPKRGYRFVATVTTVDRETAVAVPPSPRHRRPWLRAAVPAVAMLALAALIGIGTLHSRSPEGPRPNVVAVMPFDNATGDPANEVLAYALTDELIGRLGPIAPNRLRVIARTSVMRYRDTRTDVAEVADKLDADYVLEGSVRDDGNGLMVTARLIDAASQSFVWGDSYRRGSDAKSLLAQELPARMVGKVLGVAAPSVGLPPPKRQQADADRLETYRKARYLLSLGTAEDTERALSLLRELTAEAPDMAAAHASLATALMAWPGRPKTDELVRRARRAAQRAVALDPHCADAYRALGLIALFYERNWQAARERLERAVELAPGNAANHHAYALWLSSRGRHREAVREIDLAYALDPESIAVNADVLFLHFYARDYARAIEAAEKCLRLYPDFLGAKVYQVLAWSALGQRAEAVQDAREALARGASEDAQALAAMAPETVLRRFWEMVLGYLDRASGERPIDPLPVARTRLLLGQDESALALIEEAIERRYFSYFLPYLGVSPVYDDLRDEPRFIRALRKLDLPQAASTRGRD